MLDWAEYSKLFIGLLAIVNPFGVIPIYLGVLEQHASRVDYAAAARRTTLVVLGVLLVTLLSGEFLLRVFGISLSAFRVAGGILLLLMAIDMLAHSERAPRGQQPVATGAEDDHESIAVVPLGMPLLAGPGAISTVIVYADRGSGFGHYLALTTIVLGVGLAVYLCLSSAPRIRSFAGRTSMQVTTRLMGLITAAIAVEIMGNGLAGLFPALRPGMVSGPAPS